MWMAMEPAREAQPAPLVSSLGELGGDVGVFDHADAAVQQREVADLFRRARLGQHLRGHLRTVKSVQADEKRVHGI